MHNIIKSLKAARLNKGLKQQELGLKLGMPQSHISKIESGDSNPRLSTVEDMARLLDLELMLIPRPLYYRVQTLIHGEKEDEHRWKPDEGEDEP